MQRIIIVRILIDTEYTINFQLTNSKLFLSKKKKKKLYNPNNYNIIIPFSKIFPSIKERKLVANYNGGEKLCRARRFYRANKNGRASYSGSVIKKNGRGDGSNFPDVAWKFLATRGRSFMKNWSGHDISRLGGIRWRKAGHAPLVHQKTAARVVTWFNIKLK